MRQLGSWISDQTPSAMLLTAHSQQGRLARVAPRRSLLSGDRLQGIDGLGNLGEFGVEEEEIGGTTYDVGSDEWQKAKDLESDSDYSWLVKSLLEFGGKVTPSIIQAATKVAEKRGIDVGSILAMGQSRAAAVQSGTAGLPTGAWVGIGIAVAAVLGIALMAMSRR